LSAAGAALELDVHLELPDKLEFLTGMHRYKVVYGGRGASKSWSFADALLVLGTHDALRILCAREIQESIKKSVHRLLSDRIQALGLGAFYQVLETEIRGINGTMFAFSGLGLHTAESIKSFEGFDIVWVEEAQTVKKRSWDILIPTIRANGSEIWISFNPDMDTDDTWERFVVNPPPGAVVVKMNYSDNPWFPPVLEAERQHCQKTAPQDYDNIWEGKCRSIVAGAIYASEVLAMIEEQRYGHVPYDPRYPVHCVWDLGWNDAMSLIMVQKPMPTVANIVNYMEGSFLTYAQWIAIRGQLGYVWGDDWLPFDAAQHNPISGTNARKTLTDLGCKVKQIAKTNDEARIRAGRMMFPRIFISSVQRKAPPEAPLIFHGGPRLMDCLKRYKRSIPISTGEPASPVHDQYSHGADAFGGLAEIIEQIRNKADRAPAPTLPPYENSIPSMGCLG